MSRSTEENYLELEYSIRVTFDRIIPIKELKTPQRPSDLWYGTLIKALKLTCKQAERKQWTSYADKDKKALEDVLRQYQKETVKAKVEHYSGAILAPPNSEKKVFDIMHELRFQIACTILYP
ncbi:hypothetical protein NDU88_002666 [Pleurodeles waltl]|uniref:Uncharacterized protein n=1 Tax=Pleurodeles waltl TaxID=8319 RepID=A0AAV7VF79_PLEWA|nr:hypothetical protein NDU88_002666 [Pleurodeles waltl]